MCTKNAKERNKIKILIAAGPSAGHIYPAMAFIERLKQRDNHAAVQLVLPRNSIKKFSSLSVYTIQYINLSAPAANIRKIAEFISGWIKSLLILIRFQPDVVLGFGSIVPVPFIIFAWLLRIETIIHEQNVLPGRANRLLAVFVDKIAVSFEETKHYLKNYQTKITVTGNPLRRKIIRLDRAAALNYLGLDDNKRTILVMGGSQGSSKINREFVHAASLLKDTSLIQVIHLSGSNDFAVLKQGYEKLNIKFCLFAFFDFMEYAYSAADLVVSRAGATSIAEIIFYQLPAILIPYPYAYNHQYRNAKALEQKGCGIIIEERNLDAGILKERLERFLDNQPKLAEMRLAYEKFPRADAGELLVNPLFYGRD